MANVDFPSGLRPIRNQNGSSPQVIAMDCVTTLLYENSLAFLSNTGLVGMCSATTVSSALAPDIVGVFTMSKAAGAAGADGSQSKILVNIDPEQLYIVQSDDNTLAAVGDFVGRNFPITAATANAGNTTTLRSIIEIDGNAGSSGGNMNTTNAEILQVVGQYSGRQIDGDLTSNGKFIVKLRPKAHIHRNDLGV